jgi:hypothetical protein
MVGFLLVFGYEHWRMKAMHIKIKNQNQKGGIMLKKSMDLTRICQLGGNCTMN